MKNLIRTSIAFLFLAGLIFWAYTAIKHQKKVNSPDYIVNHINIDALQQNVKTFLEVHKAYLKKLKDFENQIIEAGSKIENNQKSVAALAQVGDDLFDAHFLELAAKYYQIGLAISPQNSLLNYKLGLIYANLGMFYRDKQKIFFVKAEDLYKKSIQFNTRDVLPYYALASLYTVSFEKKVKTGSLEEAYQYINQYIRLAPNRTNGYFLRARISFLTGNKGKAVQDYQIIMTMTKPHSREYQVAQENIKKIA